MDEGKIEELKPPHTLDTASRAVEIARIWIVDRKLQVCLSGNQWEDPAAWGLLLVDLAHHVANSYEAQGRDRDLTVQRIFEALDVERRNRTSDSEQI